MNKIRNVIVDLAAHRSGGHARRHRCRADYATCRERCRPSPHVLHPCADLLLLTTRAASGDAV